MVFVILLAAMLPIVIYGFWMAGELGVGPRLRRPRTGSGEASNRDSPTDLDTLSGRDAN